MKGMEVFEKTPKKIVVFCFRNFFIVCLILLTHFNILGRVVIADELKLFRDLWEQKKYKEVYQGLKTYRKKEPYAKNSEVYYLIGTSLCRMPDTNHLGWEYLQWIIDNFAITPEQYSIVEQEQAKCSETISSIPIKIVFNDTRTTAGISGRTKMFYFSSDESPFASNPVEVIENISRDVIRKRLFEKSQPEKAKKFVEKQIDHNPITEASENFILANNSSISKLEIKNQLRILERVFDFFIKYYGMRKPEHFITVYWVADSEALQKFARKLHGIQLAQGSAGYSYRDDLSMVVSFESGPGTLLHELFHLMVRNNFGDIPPWLDEGLAALYEVSKMQGSKVLGLPNWRGRIMERLRELRPHIRELITMNWHEFNSLDSQKHGTARQAINYATARYFCLYLQEKGFLQKIYQDFYLRDVGDNTNVVKLIENKFPHGLDKLDKEFEQWVYTPR